MATPEKVSSSLPLVKSGKREVRLAGYALYSSLFAIGVILLMAFFILANAPDGNISQAENAALDQSDFDNAEFSQSMGRLNESLKSYDNILARNQSNVKAWNLKGYTLSRLDRYDEALVCYNRALEIDPGYYQAVYGKSAVLGKVKELGYTS